MKAVKFRDLGKEELIEKEKGIKKDLFDLTYQRKIGQVEKPHQFKAFKKDIARIMTILRERDLSNERNDKKTE